ncbi:hypothetical protein [Nocardia sp. XZ_19_385]|uniref:hypothetical protein n=1 Tax=Nocardia sp. XZ_19_385 TaxID=2769488 RepID=UPI0018904A0C|nr:hypothetical protein [Nocardia sp. XZ_19_385]
MTAHRPDRAELVALEAEKRRLNVVDSVLSDMLDAATDSRQAKDYQNCAGENEKLAHWDSVHIEVWAERKVVSNRALDVEWGKQKADEIRARTAARITEAVRPAKRRGIERSR